MKKFVFILSLLIGIAIAVYSIPSARVYAATYQGSCNGVANPHAAARIRGTNNLIAGVAISATRNNSDELTCTWNGQLVSSNASCTTDGTGICGLDPMNCGSAVGGSFTVTGSKTGYTCTPTSATIANNTNYTYQAIYIDCDPPAPTPVPPTEPPIIFPTNTPVPPTEPPIIFPTTPPPPPPATNTPAPGTLTCSFSTNTAGQGSCSNSGDYCVQFFPSYNATQPSFSGSANQCWNFGNGNGCNTNSQSTYRNYTKTGSWQTINVSLNATENGGGGRNTSCNNYIQVPPNPPPGGGPVAPPPSGCVSCYLCDNGTWRFAGKPGGGCYTASECTAAGHSTNSTRPAWCVAPTQPPPPTPTPQPTATPIPYGPVSGTIYYDDNDNGVIDGDSAFRATPVTVSLNNNGGAANSSTANGTYTISSVRANNYTATATKPNGYKSIIPSSQDASFSNSSGRSGVNFLVQGYKITGNVFLDANFNGAKDSEAGFPADSNMSGVTITLSGGANRSISTDGSGNFVFSSLPSGSYRVTLTVPQTPYKHKATNGVCSTSDCKSTTYYDVSITNADQSVNFGVTRLLDVACSIYLDRNDNNVVDAEDTLFPSSEGNQTVTLTRTVARTGAPAEYTKTTSAGNCTMQEALNGPYRINLPVPTNYRSVLYSPSNNLTVANENVPVNILVQGYSVSGSVYLDKNKNNIKDASEPDYDTTASILDAQVAPTYTTYGSITTATGAYKLAGLKTGTYRIRYTNLPDTFEMTYPQNATPPFYTVTVGPTGCTTDTSHGSSCDANGNIINLHFGLSNEFPWIQGTAGDIRLDRGTVNPIPGSFFGNTDGAGTTPGLWFMGDGAFSFCLGRSPAASCIARASSKQWVVGGLPANYPEVFVPRQRSLMRTSFAYYAALIQQNKITPTDLATVCTVENCTLPANLANGVYNTPANTNVVLNAYTFSANKNYVFLINGNLTIKGNIVVPNGSTTTWSVSGDITVDKTLGISPSTTCTRPITAGATSTGCNIEGFFSADGSIIIDTNTTTDNLCRLDGTGLDSRLNLAGAFVANAARSSDSTKKFNNKRDLCADDLTSPTVAIIERPDFILNAPEFLKHSDYTWQEVAP